MGDRIEMKLLAGEYWWGGIVRHGERMPYGAHADCRETLTSNLDGNQGCPLLVSSKGRYLWSEEPFSFEFKGGGLIVDEALGAVAQGEGHGNLRGAYLAACKRFFPPSGRVPHELAFRAPQYNAWIEVQRYPSQDKILQYAQAILDAGMPPGVLIIDDFWYRNNGLWKWDTEAFPDPKAMVARLREMGFVVMLWISPFVTCDTRQYWWLKRKGYLLMGEGPDPAVYQWWNGFSAMLDLSNPQAVAWLQGELDELVRDYGVTGFKFDGGDPWGFFKTPSRGHLPHTPNGRCEDFGRVGLKYDLSEYRACWKLGGQHLLQRVRDKYHKWDYNGFADLIPTSLAQGLIGYPYTCPDMVGGGESEDKASFDQELFVRWAQCSTFFPMIQYSRLPSRLLDAQHLQYTMAMVDLRMKLGGEICELARHAATTGEPILRHMAYEFPDEGMEQVADQYMLGGKYLVAPVMEKGATSRRIKFPGGSWRGDDGSEVAGPCEIEVAAPLSRLPWYTRLA
ncbi:MAG: glycoside hydrolase family 31 protein [Phycisphaerae bacterium]|jgi:alpha-glucosidase (family GH31 glycosyl hydrolase)